MPRFRAGFHFDDSALIGGESEADLWYSSRCRTKHLHGTANEVKSFFFRNGRTTLDVAGFIFFFPVAVFFGLDFILRSNSTRDVDPWSAGEGMLFLMLGFKALPSELPFLSGLLALVLAVLASCSTTGNSEVQLGLMWLIVPFLLVCFSGTRHAQQTERAILKDNSTTQP